MFVRRRWSYLVAALVLSACDAKSSSDTEPDTEVSSSTGTTSDGTGGGGGIRPNAGPWCIISNPRPIVTWKENGEPRSNQSGNVDRETRSDGQSFLINAQGNGDLVLSLSSEAPQKLAPGSFSCDPGAIYGARIGETDSKSKFVQASACAITVESFGHFHGDHAKGTFSGTIALDGAEVDITDGTFDAVVCGEDFNP